jgi:geranylgeranyl diphosphate synthase type I
MTTAPDIQPAHQALRRTRTMLEPALYDWVHRLPEPIRRIASYHFGWTDAAGEPDAGLGGKSLRPALVLSCAEAVGGTARTALPPAVAVELVHNFSLLHDDILDGDTTRRHRATAWAVFGSPGALLTGDALLTHACRVLAEDELPRATAGIRWLSESTTRLIEGEQSDVGFEERDRVSLADCLAMTDRKTAELLACSCALGALWGGGSPERITALRSFGRHLGMAFQLTDDLLGIWGDPSVTGKPAGADLASRKKSLPVVAALSADGPAAQRLAALYRPLPGDAEPDSAQRLTELAELVDLAGGRAWAERSVTEERERALEALDAAQPDRHAAEELIALAQLVCRRTH